MEGRWGSILVQGTLDAKGEILGHEASLHGFNTSLLEVVGELGKGGVVVELGAVGQTPGPGEDGGDGVGGGLTAGLELAVVAGDGSVGSLGLNDLAVGGKEDTGHQTKGAITLSNAVALHITIIVFAGPDEATLTLHGVGNHVVDEAVLVPDTGGLVLGLEVSVVHLLEEVLEASVVLLQDGVLGTEVEGPFLLERVLQAALGESEDGLVGVVHAHGYTATWEVEDVVGDWFASVLGGKSELQFAGTLNYKVGGLVLVSVGMATNDDGLLPARDEAGDIVTNDGLAEHSSSEDVTDGSVGALPHLLQFELCRWTGMRNKKGKKIARTTTRRKFMMLY